MTPLPLTINSAKAEEEDLYAFGVLLLELLTGKKYSYRLEPREENYLMNWDSSRLHDNESLEEIVEPALRTTITARNS
ncbi:protein STRUBBELIG-receptor family 2 [Tanacetum coccineum]